MLGRGYMAPEYAVLGQLSVKLDVYSLGVLILEIVTGRKNTDMLESAAGESISMLSYVSCSPSPTYCSFNFHTPLGHWVRNTVVYLYFFLELYSTKADADHAHS